MELKEDFFKSSDFEKMNKHWKPAAWDLLWALSVSYKCLPASEAGAKADASGRGAEITMILLLQRITRLWP